MSEKLRFRGRFSIILRDSKGRIKVRREIDNLITNNGFDAICAQISGTPGNAFNYIAIGTGTNLAAATDTALQTEVARAQATYAHTNGTKTFTLTYTFGAGVGTGAITESGVLNAASGGTLLCRQVFTAINKLAGDTLQVVWSFSVS